MEIDVNHGGELLFDEFARWALQNHLDLDDDLTDDDGEVQGLVSCRVVRFKKMLETCASRLVFIGQSIFVAKKR